MYKKAALFLAFLLMIGIIYPNKSTVSASGNPIFGAQNYIVYYSDVTSANLASISSYDLAILGPSGVNATMLAALKKTDTLLFAYVSAHEIEKYDSLKISLLNESDYLYINGVKQFNSSWDCYSGDPR
ncbi:MAG TPA: hypothetical protein VIL27_10450, partial [Clostridia bacterium]